MSRILIIPDAYYTEQSGAVAARSAALLFQDLGHEVAIYCEIDENYIFSALKKIDHFERTRFRGSQHILGNNLRREFRTVINHWKPSHVFFLGSSYNKPVSLLRECHNRNITTFALWWVHDFYCGLHYGALKDGPCEMCLTGNFFHSLGKKCRRSNVRKVDAVTLLLRVTNRFLMKKEILKVNAVLGSSKKQIEIYKKYGFRDNQIFYCPLFWDKKRISDFVSVAGDYFVFFSSLRYEKGAHLIKEILERCPNIKLVIPVTSTDLVGKTIDFLRLHREVENGKVQVLGGLTWNNGVQKLISNSRGVLNPSIWSTTTEYTLLESLGLAKPVVVFDVGIHAEIIEHGKNGLICRVGDTESYCNYINILNQDNALYNELSKGALELYEKVTNEISYEKAIREIFNCLISSAESVGKGQ